MQHPEYEWLIEEIEDLKELSELAPIIVEGKRDEEALRGLDIEAEFLWISSTPFHEFCDVIVKSYPEVILFTDMDNAGNMLARRVKNHLVQRGVRVHDKFRPSIMSKLDTHQVENISTRLNKIEGDLFGFSLY